MKNTFRKTTRMILTVLLITVLFSGMLTGCIRFHPPQNAGSQGSAAQAGSEKQETAQNKPDLSSSGQAETQENTPEEEAEEIIEEEPPEEQSDLLPVKEAADALMKIYDSREFDESLDLSQNPGLLSVEDVTGPFLRIEKEADTRFVPDLIGSDIVDNPELPSGAKIVPEDEEFFPKKYLPLIQTPEKTAEAASGKRPVVYAVLEYLGYHSAGEYSSDFVLYYHDTRVSFYSMETGEMLGWMTTSKSRTGPWVLMTNQYSSDGQHPIYHFKGGSIWSDTAWSNALDELFYDANGYQVVGTTLLSVPDYTDTLVIPDGVTEIADNCGQGVSASKLVIPEGVEKIGASAFSGSGLSTIQFPSSLYYCDTGVFSGTPWKENSSDWIVVGDGLLLNCNDESEELVVPDTVRYIAPEAISGLPAKKITIPETVIQCCGGLTDEADAAISYMENLEEIVFEGGLSEVLPDIRLGTFVFCENLKTVEIAYDTGELPDYWISTYVDTSELTLICPDDSPAAQWADGWDVSHHEK